MDILHILTDEQNRARVQTTEQLLTMFPNINQKLLLVTKDGFTILNQQEKLETNMTWQRAYSCQKN